LIRQGNTTTHFNVQTTPEKYTEHYHLSVVSCEAVIDEITTVYFLYGNPFNQIQILARNNKNSKSLQAAAPLVAQEHK
jgi:hypothetical protein